MLLPWPCIYEEGVKLVLRVVMELLSFLRYRREMGEARLYQVLGEAPRLPRAGLATIDIAPGW